MDPSRLLTATLRSSSSGPAIARILAAGLDAVDPAAGVSRALKREGSQLQVGSWTADLDRFHHIWICGFGKAGYPMAAAATEILSGRVGSGLIVTKQGQAPNLSLPGGVRVHESSHPVPDERGAAAAREMEALLAQAGAEDLVLCLISGGGSALLPAPCAGLHLEDIQATTSALLACGADIQQINTVRKHLDRLKGGGLARAASPAHLVALILSDVIGDPLDVIASGPTVPDPTTFGDALAVLDGYDLRTKVPLPVRQRLEAGQRGEAPETPKPGNAIFERVHTEIIGSNITAARAAAVQAEKEWFHTLLLTTSLQGEARQAGRFLASIAQQIHASGDPLSRPACLIAGGETTVTLQGTGLGGRNQELALGAVNDLAGLPDAILVALATDGGDGPTDAAGAVVSGESAARARQLGLLPASYLANNDAYHFFEPLGDLLKPGPTQTNVNDLTFLFLL